MKTKNKTNFTARLRPKFKMITLTVSIVALISSAAFAMIGISISRSQEMLSRESAERARIMEPIDYEIAFIDANTLYQIEQNGSTFTIPAKELQLRITRGAVRTISVLRHNGERLYYMYTLNTGTILDATNSGEWLVITTGLDSQPLVQDGIFYDYFFLYMAPVQGAPILEMIVVEVDINNGAILRNVRYQGHEARRLILSEQFDGPTRHMFEVFQEVRSVMIYL